MAVATLSAIAHTIRKRRRADAERYARERQEQVRKREDAQRTLARFGIPCLSQNVDTVAEVGLIDAISSSKIVGPRASVIEDVLRQLRAATPKEGHHLISIGRVSEAIDILDAGGEFRAVYESELSHSEPCGECNTPENSCWGNCPRPKWVLERPEKLEITTIRSPDTEHAS